MCGALPAPMSAASKIVLWEMSDGAALRSRGAVDIFARRANVAVNPFDLRKHKRIKSCCSPALRPKKDPKVIMRGCYEGL